MIMGKTSMRMSQEMNYDVVLWMESALTFLRGLPTYFDACMYVIFMRLKQEGN